MSDTSGVKPRSLGKRALRTLLVAVGLALFLWYFWLYHPMGSGPAGPTVAPTAFSQVWSRRPVVLLGMGDSVTAGFGASKGHSYFDRLAVNPPDEFEDMRGICLRAVLPNLRTENRAVSGSTSLQHEDRLVRRLHPYDAIAFGIVVLTTGGNDLIHNYGQTPPAEGAMYGSTWEQAQPWIADFDVRLDKMIARLRALFPGGCAISLGNIYDPTDGVGTAFTVGLPSWRDGLRIHAAYNEVIAHCAAKHPDVHLVDIHGPLLGHGIFSRQFWNGHYHANDPNYWFYDNFEDPNDRGYDAIRRLFLNKMVTVLPSAVQRRVSRQIGE
jgi:lysophospholipase L1-like esterase